ncbi:MAG TPA: DUF397 domain-containing protein [Actinophytocola sp.]|jgi:hypothetical protein|nr:DUF397 domain-containing protein [Actinophytocola sp.]
MWRKSSETNTGNCVEIRRDLSAVRDSKDPGRALDTPGLPALIGLLKDGRQPVR